MVCYTFTKTSVLSFQTIWNVLFGCCSKYVDGVYQNHHNKIKIAGVVTLNFFAKTPNASSIQFNMFTKHPKFWSKALILWMEIQILKFILTVCGLLLKQFKVFCCWRKIDNLLCHQKLIQPTHINVFYNWRRTPKDFRPRPLLLVT